MRSRPRSLRPRRLGAALLVVGLGASACAADPDVRAATPGDVALVVVGDSLTAGSEPMADGEVRGEGSWVPAALGEPLVLAGGWAVPGATTADMRRAVEPVPGDVLVLMAGTNDVAAARDWAASRDDLLAVARTVRVEEVVVSAIPPFDPHPEAAVGFNERLRQVADEQGWTFVDPWGPAGRDGTWAEGASADGVHPTPEVAGEAGRALRDAVLARAAGD